MVKKWFVGSLLVLLIVWFAVLVDAVVSSKTGSLDEDQESGTPLLVQPNGMATYSMLPDGTTIGFIGTAYLESSKAPNTRFSAEETFTGTAGSGITSEQTGTYYNSTSKPRYARFRIENKDDDNTSDGFGYTLTDKFNVTNTKMVSSGSRVGATSGWAFTFDKGSLGQLPDSQTGSTLVVPLDFEVGDIIISYNLLGQIEGDSGTGTIDVDMRKLTAAAADLTDASIGNLTDAVTTAGSDLLLSASNTAVTLSVPEEVEANESLYLLITGWTLPTSDIEVQSAKINYTR